MTSKLELIPKYEIGEKVLCFHGPLLYEAKCLDVKVKEEKVTYFVHYQGWNKNWDEWVTDKRMFKYNEDGLKKQKEIEVQVKSGKKIKGLRKCDLLKQSLPPPEILKDTERTLKPSEIKDTERPSGKPKSTSEQLDSVPSTSVDVEPKDDENARSAAQPCDEPQTQPMPPLVSARRRKGRHATTDGSIESDEGLLARPQLKVEIPDSLKAWLVDDWDLITRQARLLELPASFPISSLMSDFLQRADIKIEPDDSTNTAPPPAPACNTVPLTSVSINSDLRHEFIAGLQHYFNLIIGSQLLYKFERLQYAEIMKQQADKRMSDIYGPMHLLRLFVKLREMVSCTKVDTFSLPILESLVSDFLQFLHQNRHQYFRIQDYTVATAEYQRRSMC